MLSSLLPVHWTRKPLRLCVLKQGSRVQNSFARFNDRRLNWQTRPLTKRISTSFRCPRTKKTFSYLWSQARKARTTQFCSAHRTTLVLQTKSHWQGDFRQRSQCLVLMHGALELQTNCLDHGLRIIRQILCSLFALGMVMLQRCNASCVRH